MPNRGQLLLENAAEHGWLAAHNGDLVLVEDAIPAEQRKLLERYLKRAGGFTKIDNENIGIGAAGEKARVDWQAMRQRQALREIPRVYARNAGRLGPLGTPITGIVPDGAGYTQQFQGGNIKFLDFGKLEANQTMTTTVRYKGLHCFGEQKGIGADEPYVIVSVYPPGKREKTTTTKFPASGSYEGVTSKSERVDVADVMTDTPPTDVVVHAMLCEHDSGDEAAVEATVKEALDKGVDATEAALGVGPVPGWVDYATVGMSKAVTEIFGLGDDVIGTYAFSFSFVDLQTLAWTPRPLQRFGGIEYTHETPLLSDGDASYKLYFEVFTRIVTQNLPTR